MTEIEKLKRQVALLNTLVIGAKEFEAEVTNVDDPLGLNKIKVKCFSIWGENESPWLTDRCNSGGSGKGSVFTPTKGDLVSIRLRDGNPDAGEWLGAFRSTRSPIPSEFSNPDINGLKTKSGIIETYNDVDGSYTVENANGGIIKLMPDGSIEGWGTHCKIHTTTELNSDSPQYGVITAGPSHLCPFSGKPHKGSTAVKASE